MKRSRSLVIIQCWKKLFISSITLPVDPYPCLCSGSIHSLPSDHRLFHFISSESLICPSKWIYIFSRLYSLPDSFFISYDPTFKSVLEDVDSFSYDPEEYDETIICKKEEEMKFHMIVNHELSNEISNNWYYKGLKKIRKKHKEECGNRNRIENTGLVKQICQVSFIPDRFLPPNFFYINNPSIEFYTNCLHVFCSLLANNFYSPHCIVSYNPHFPIDFLISNSYVSRFVDIDFLNLSDFYLLFREFISNSLKYQKIIYYHYQKLQESYSEPQKYFEHDRKQTGVLNGTVNVFEQLVCYIREYKGDEFVKRLGYDK